MKSSLQKLLARFYLLISGWKVSGNISEIPRCVIIGGPHTSNWDFVHGMIFKFYHGLDIHFLMKSELFHFPFKRFFLWIGGIPVDRKKHENLVEILSERIRKSDNFYLAMAPEGSRKAVAFWRSGFYYIAKQADVPIVLGYIDYKRKVVGIGPILLPGASMQQDAEIISAFYSTIQAKYPRNFTQPVVLHDCEKGTQDQIMAS